MRQTSAPCFVPLLPLRRPADDEKTTGGIFVVDPPESREQQVAAFLPANPMSSTTPPQNGTSGRQASHFLNFPPKTRSTCKRCPRLKLSHLRTMPGFALSQVHEPAPMK